MLFRSEFSLRNIHNDRFKIVNRNSGTTLTEMSRPQVYREAHTRAIYLHDGVQYQVTGTVCTATPLVLQATLTITGSSTCFCS